MIENGNPLDRAESRMAKADAAIDAKALGALAKDAGIEGGPNRDAALGLPLVMLGSDATRRLDELTDGTKPGPTTPSRKDAASLSTKPDKYGEVLAREFDAFAKLRRSLTTPEQHDALTAYEEAIDASRRARNDMTLSPSPNGGGV